MTDPLRIAMWSGPRNISTAMMRSFGNRPDTAVIDEPFYAAYLVETGLQHPMRDAVIASQPADWRSIVATLMGKIPGERPVFYQKHMTHHMLPFIDRDWMGGCRNVFLIRSPWQVLASYRARHDHVTLDDIGIRQQAELFDMVSDALGHAAPVFDAADILAQPEPALQCLCAAIGLTFLPSMLHWPAGRRPTDGAWAPAWYQSVEASTGFSSPREESVLDDALRPIADRAVPIYERLAAHRIQVGHTSGAVIAG